MMAHACCAESEWEACCHGAKSPSSCTSSCTSSFQFSHRFWRLCRCVWSCRPCVAVSVLKKLWHDWNICTKTVTWLKHMYKNCDMTVTSVQACPIAHLSASCIDFQSMPACSTPHFISIIRPSLRYDVVHSVRGTVFSSFFWGHFSCSKRLCSHRQITVLGNWGSCLLVWFWLPVMIMVIQLTANLDWL